MIKRFEEIKTRQNARELVDDVYRSCVAGTLANDY
jgi:hypothetical protein